MDALLVVVVISVFVLGFGLYQIQQTVRVVSSQLAEIQRELNSTKQGSFASEALKAFHRIEKAIDRSPPGVPQDPEND